VNHENISLVRILKEHSWGRLLTALALFAG